MDCTLLDTVGFSYFNNSFYSCFAFLKEEEDYIQALKMFEIALGVNFETMVIILDRELALMNAIKLVFPKTINLLCVSILRRIF